MSVACSHEQASQDLLRHCHYHGGDWWKWWCYQTPFEGWGAEELRGVPTVGPRPQVYGPQVKNGSSAKDGVSKRLRCGLIQKEVSYELNPAVRRRCKMMYEDAAKILLPFYYIGSQLPILLVYLPIASAWRQQSD